MPIGYNYEAKIETPKGMTEEEFDANVLRHADNYPVKERPYYAIAGYNSNTYVDDVIEGAGGVMPKIKNAWGQKWNHTKEVIKNFAIRIYFKGNEAE